MITELLEMSNRRIWSRTSAHAPVSGGYTLNVSLRGARIVTRQPMRSKIRLRLELDEVIELEAEPMWQQELGRQNRVVGLRFKPDARQESILAAWIARQAS
jgi:hypothetical protein